MSAKFVVGIDLGTTHSALALAALGDTEERVSVLEIEQLVAPGALAKRTLLPSFLYFAHESEPALALPWDGERRFCVGEFARSRGGRGAAARDRQCQELAILWRHRSPRR